MTKTETHPSEKPFICPECGSRRSLGHHYYRPSWTIRSGAPSSPWGAVPQSFDCADCFNTIPGHLAMRWEGRTLEEAQKQWVKVFRPLRDEDEVRLIEMLAAGWEVVGEGNDSIELWDNAYDVCASIEELIEEINSKNDDGVDWSFLTSLDGIETGYELSQWGVTNVEDLLSHFDGVNLHQHGWSSRGGRFGVYKHMLVKKVERYRVMKELEAVASELAKQLGIPWTTA